jgi:hypothetical protein
MGLMQALWCAITYLWREERSQSKQEGNADFVGLTDNADRARLTSSQSRPISVIGVIGEIRGAFLF